MKFENRLVLSAMAGINNAEFCSKHRAAIVILGGFNADEGAMKAARMVVKRGRKEFIFDDPIEGIENEVRKMKRPFAVNIRSSTIDGYLEAAEVVDDYGGILEINAHCRQPEFIKARCGEWLLYNKDVLLKIVRKVSEICPTFVKIRGSLQINYNKLVDELFRAGCRVVHVDAMILNGGCNLKLIAELSKHGPIIGNNSFIDIASGEAMINAGAKMASAARIVLKNPKFFDEMLKSKILSQPVEL